MPGGSQCPATTLAAAAPPLGADAEPVTAVERKLRRVEAHVAWMRDGVAAFLWPTVPWLVGRPEVAAIPFLAMVLAGTVHTVLAHAGYRRDWGGLRDRRLLTSLGDATIVLAIIAVSGGWASPLTPLLYVSMAAIAYRYELAHGLALGLGYGTAYLAVLLASGDLGDDPAAVAIRVGLLVATGVLASLSSRSFLEAEEERALAQDTLADVLDTVPGDVALIPRHRVLDDPDAGQVFPALGPIEEALADQMPLDAVQRARGALFTAFAIGETVEFETTVQREDGAAAYQTIVAPLNDEASPQAAVVVSTDVTDRKRAEHRLRDHARALRQSNRALARYASITAHDLREPVRDIVRYLQRIERREPEPSEESREELAFVIARARRLDTLVRALHGFAEVDERPLAIERVDLAAALDRALARLDLEDPGALELQTGDLGRVTADRDAIEEILEQLLENAHEHGGRDPVRVWVDSEETSEGWRIVVEDDGQGIPPSDHECIFQPFRPRGPDATSTEARVGLATVRRLVERLGGEIGVESELGAGARFTFTVPRRPVLAEAERRGETEPGTR
jgi:signal transduction histidine kinase